jgi:hypothetical protein
MKLSKLLENRHQKVCLNNNIIVSNKLEPLEKYTKRENLLTMSLREKSMLSGLDIQDLRYPSMTKQKFKEVSTLTSG